MKKFLPLIIIILLFIGGLILFGRAVYHSPETQINATNQGTTGSPTITTPHITFIDPVAGDREARVTLVEFGDYFCEACKAVDPVVRSVVTSYPHQVRLVWKDFPNDGLHPGATAAAEAARCAGEQGKFWDYHELLFTRAAPFTIISYTDLATSLGLDRAAFEACLTSRRMAPVVHMISAEAQALNIPSVPFFFLNNKQLNASSPADFASAIDPLITH